MLQPSTEEMLARARVDLRCGLPVAIGSRLVLSIETLTPKRVEALRDTAGGLQIALTEWRARTLKLTCYDAGVARLRVPDAHDTSWIKAMADPARDLAYPVKGPFQPIRGPGADGLSDVLELLKSAFLLPAALIAEIGDARGFASENKLTWLDPSDLVALVLRPDPQLVMQARVPLAVSQAGRVHVFRPKSGGEEHYAVEIGAPDRSEPVLARLHSACFTGDVLGSLKCDCGAQLDSALQQMAEAGSGVLLYLNQEGRGIGLANKMRAYALQDQGFDTVEANHRLGFFDDERDFRIGAELLKTMGFSSIRLMTNNPAKIETLAGCGIAVTERVPLKVGHHDHNRDYLATKARKSGHLL